VNMNELMSIRQQDWAFQCALRDAVLSGKEKITWVGPYTRACTRRPLFWPRGASKPVTGNFSVEEVFG